MHLKTDENEERMTTLFGLKNCDTCRKAMKSLEDVVFVDVRSEGVPQETLEAAFQQFGRELANNRSATWRNLTDEERNLPILDLLMQHPTLMKRPLISKDGALYLGWSKDTQAAVL